VTVKDGGLDNQFNLMTPKEISCSSCNVHLQYAGTKNFHEGKRWGILGDLGELFVNKEKFDVYFLPKMRQGGILRRWSW
jgi:hypothetical protein